MSKPVKDRLFVPAPFFMARIATGSIDHFFQMVEEKNLRDALLTLYQRDLVFQEAILVASPSLYAALQKNPVEESTVASLLRYFLRMCSRTTPFGLFSFVAWGHWGKSPSCSISCNKVVKRARPDMEWFLSSVDNMSGALIKTNPLVMQSGDRLELAHVRGNQEGISDAVSIRNTFLTKAILSCAKIPIAKDVLANEMMGRFPSLELSKVEGLIDQLVEKQFLNSTLLPSLLTRSPLRDLLQKHPLPWLKEIASKIDLYNQTPLGQGCQEIEKIVEEMKEKVPSNSYLQVDSVFLEKKLVLPEALGEELGEALELLWGLSFTNPGVLFLQKYHKQFIEKYGSSRLVPLLEVLNENQGLGPLVDPDPPILNAREKKWKEWLSQELASSLHQQKSVIMLTDQFVNEERKEEALPSFDLYAEVIAESQESLEQGNYLLSIASLGWQAGATLGRFIPLFSQQEEEELATFFREEESLAPGTLFVDTSFLPDSKRLGNVTIVPCLRKAAIDCGGGYEEKGALSLEDLYLGSTGERLFVTTKEGEIEIVAIQSNRLHEKRAPAAIRLIRKIATARSHLILPFSWRELESFPYLPRVQYKKVILSAARWKIVAGQFKPKQEEAELIAWLQVWRVPRFIFLLVGDQKILLDSQSPLHVAEMVHRLKQKEGLVLVEKIDQDKKSWIRSEKGSHLGEFVIPFIKNKKFQAALPVLRPFHRVDPLDRMRLLGSDWLFIKLYLKEDQMDPFLVERMAPFLQELQEEGVIERGFFLRYLDTGSHLRLRMQSDKMQELISIVHDWADFLLQEKLIGDVVTSCYEREVERYGGIALMEFAEKFFCADSAVVFSLLEHIMKNKLETPNYVIAALSLNNLLDGFGLDDQAQIKWFSFLRLNEAHLSGFREWKPWLLQESTSLHSPFSPLFAKRKEALTAYRKAIDKAARENRLTNRFEDLVASCLHLHCNRLLGLDSRLEQKAHLFACHLTSSLRYCNPVLK